MKIQPCQFIINAKFEAIKIRKKTVKISFDGAEEIFGVDLGIDSNRNLLSIENNHRNPRLLFLKKGRKPPSISLFRLNNFFIYYEEVM
ncbi:hypothetical protein [Halalkalibacter lacteus]|uniref:hypothetical protein n=1 Tax=Halalkalibacter lacteus TaxID=3090663 RepID=UPI002FC85AA2